MLATYEFYEIIDAITNYLFGLFSVYLKNPKMQTFDLFSLFIIFKTLATIYMSVSEGPYMVRYSNMKFYNLNFI